jgi:hypothetical protein
VYQYQRKVKLSRSVSISVKSYLVMMSIIFNENLTCQTVDQFY